MFRSKSAKAYNEAREKVAAVNADFAENVAGLRVTQSFRREQANRARFGRLSDAFRVTRLRTQRYIAVYFPFVQTLSTVAGAIVLVAATGQVRNGTLGVGALIAYLLYIDMVFSPSSSSPRSSTATSRPWSACAGSRSCSGSARPPRSPADPVVAGRLRGRIELRDVDFGYAGSGTNAIDGVSLTIEPGETVALVGQTGAGKSTLVKLVARFYDVTGGAVLVDGTDVRDYDLASYRHRLGVVPQESYLFAGTVRDSIRYARPDASDAEVEAAARATGAHDMISGLPGGYDHQVSERGRNLSAGQRQLIALARAQLADPGHPAARRGDRGPRPGRRGGGEPRHQRADARPAPPSWSPTASPPPPARTGSWSWTPGASRRSEATRNSSRRTAPTPRSGPPSPANQNSSPSSPTLLRGTGIRRTLATMRGPVRSALRWLTRVTRPLALRSAGKEGSGTSVVRHVGRRSGRSYQTPVVAVEHDDSFLIALPYGERTDWLKNVLAKGSATLVTGGRTYEVDEPEVIPMAEATTYFGPREQRMHRQFGVGSALRVRRVPAESDVT